MSRTIYEVPRRVSQVELRLPSRQAKCLSCRESKGMECLPDRSPHQGGAGSRFLLVGEAGTEHGMSALGLFPCGLVLNDVPVFSQQTVLNANNVYRNPVDW